MPAQSARCLLAAVDAGNIRVSPGLWTPFLPKMARGVHLENLRLRMPDGVHLNAFLYLPGNLHRNRKIPALVNTMPYRYEPQNDSYLARNGYAALFVDVRGTGASEGIPSDEYSRWEYQDTTHVIDWLSKQPWCNGNAGMYGHSYGAFNSVYEAAALRPPALKAIFALCGTDRRYTDDIHFPGGAMLMIDNAWALGMIISNVTPGAPDFSVHSQASTDRWNTPPWIQVFLHNQLYGPHWRYGSLAPDYARLTTPAFLGGGYLDIYQNFVPRIMKNSPAITKGILGPWEHNMEEPGPKIDWNDLQVRWFDYWLKGAKRDVLTEPRAIFYMPGWRKQCFRYKGDIPGEWRGLSAWPETVFAPPQRLYFRPRPEYPVSKALTVEPGLGAGGELTELSGPRSACKLRYRPGRGGSGQSFFPGGGYYGLDYRDEDPYGLTFDTVPLRQPVELLGFTTARLFVSSTAPVANWIIRLCDVAPDGSSYLVSRGYLNGTHRWSHTRPQPLVRDEVYEIAIEMWCVAHRFEPDHRIRIVVTNAEFPVIWPSPYLMTTTLYTGGDHASHVNLPVLPNLHFLSPNLPAAERKKVPDPVKSYELTRDFAAGMNAVFFRIEDDRITCRVTDADPARASLQFSSTANYSPLDSARRISIHADASIESTVDYFTLNVQYALRENGIVVRSRQWKDQVRRELV
jgi:putative CocE/NonD family hydrolase